MNHLTPVEIQDYLDGNLPERAGEIDNHLAECKSCREEVRQYKMLFVDLAQEKPLTLPAGFVDRVMDQIPAEVPATLADRLWRVLPIAAAAVISLVAAIIWVDWSWLGKLFSGIEITSLQREAGSIAHNASNVVPFDHTLLLLAVGVVVLLFYLERFLRHSHHRTLHVW